MSNYTDKYNDDWGGVLYTDLELLGMHPEKKLPPEDDYCPACTKEGIGVISKKYPILHVACSCGYAGLWNLNAIVSDADHLARVIELYQVRKVM